MSTRGKLWIAALVINAAFWAGMICTARAEESALPPMKVLSWVHVFGCPPPASDVILLVQDGKDLRLVRVSINKLSDEEKVRLVAMIGEVTGMNIVYKCGNAI